MEACFSQYPSATAKHTGKQAISPITATTQHSSSLGRGGRGARERLRRRMEVRGVETSGREARWRSPPKSTRTSRNPTAAAAIDQKFRIAIAAAAAAATPICAQPPLRRHGCNRSRGLAIGPSTPSRHGCRLCVIELGFSSQHRLDGPNHLQFFSVKAHIRKLWKPDLEKYQHNVLEWSPTGTKVETGIYVVQTIYSRNLGTTVGSRNDVRVSFTSP